MATGGRWWPQAGQRQAAEPSLLRDMAEEQAVSGFLSREEWKTLCIYVMYLCDLVVRK